MRAGKKFFELIQGTPLVSVVGIRGVDDGRWRCGTCGYAGAPWYGRALPGMPMSYVSEEDVGSDGLTVFALDERQGPVPALQASRWSELTGEKGTRGIRSYPLGVLRALYVDRDPPRRPRADTLRRAP